MSAPFMQLYVADYLGDTRHLTTEQHGAYLLILMTMWRSEGRLPNDGKKLARIAGCTPSRWARISGDVLAFFEVDGDELTNNRLMLELEKASEKSIQRAASGSKGGKAKALKNNKADVANATELPKHSSDIRYQIEEADASSRDSASAPLPSKPPALTANAKPNGFARFWEAYPRKVGKGAAEKAYAVALRKIGGPDPPAVLLVALERVKPTWREPDFIPHPSTWLNQARWEDEPETNTRSPGGFLDRPDPISPKLAAHEANLVRAFDGAEDAARRRPF